MCSSVYDFCVPHCVAIVAHGCFFWIRDTLVVVQMDEMSNG